MDREKMIDAIRAVIDRAGIDVLNNKKLFKSMLGDALPGSAYKNERRALFLALDVDYWHFLTDASESGLPEKERVVKLIISQLQEALGWTEERSLLVISCYTVAMGWAEIERNFVCIDIGAISTDVSFCKWMPFSGSRLTL